MKKQTVGIIGGKGIMGKFFAAFFKKNGFHTAISDKNTPLSNKKLVQLADVVIVSVPIHVTQKVIREITPSLRPDQLLLDVTSLKVFPVKEMLKSKADVIGMHPMFRPGPSGMKNQNIILCPVRAGKSKLQWLTKLFKKEGATLSTMTPRQHDTLMAIIQVLIHFHSLALGHTMRSLRIPMKKIMRIMSPVYRIQFDVVCRIFAQDPDLYAAISMFNPLTKKITKHFMKSAASLSKIIEGKRYRAFLRDFKQTQNFLGSYSAAALKESDKLIAGLTNKIKML